MFTSIFSTGIKIDNDSYWSNNRYIRVFQLPLCLSVENKVMIERPFGARESVKPNISWTHEFANIIVL